jgi:hypothetical protein
MEPQAHGVLTSGWQAARPFVSGNVETGASLWRAHTFLAGDQLANGEIPNYRQLPNGSWEYCFSPLMSAYVHDALGCFDPLSLWFDSMALDQVDAARRPILSRTVTKIRSRIRRFLAWQESVRGAWSFFGSGSALPPDIDTTACAASALLDAPIARRERDIERPARMLLQFREPSGWLENAGSRGGRPVELTAGIRTVGTANALRYLALAGMETDGLEIVLREELDSGDRDRHRMAFLFALVRAFRAANLDIDTIAAAVTGETIEHYLPGSRFAGPLTTACAMHVLLDLNYEGEALLRGRDALAAILEPTAGRRMEGLADPNCGSAALTTALAMTALARASAICL